MAKERIITGIDVGSTKVSTIIVSVTETKSSVIGVSGNVESRGINKGNIVDIDDAVESISSSLERAERMAGVSVSSAFVTVNGSNIRTLNSHGVVAVSQQAGAEITQDDIARVTEAARAVTLPTNREIIHVIPRDFIVDGQEGIKDPVGMAGIRLEVETNIIHHSSTSIRNLVKCISQVGVEVEDLIYTGLASAESVLTNTEKELGSVLIDIGGGTTSIIAFTEGSPVYASTLPIGGKYITSDLAIGLRARLEDAEKIKLRLSSEHESFMTLNPKNKKDELNIAEFGLETESIPKNMLYRIVEPRLEEIFRLVQLDLHKAGLSTKLPAGAIITGGAAATAGIERIAKNELRMPVRIGKPYGLTGLIDEIEGPAFAATVGAIIYGKNKMESMGGSFFDLPSSAKSGFLGQILTRIKKFLP